MDQWVSQLRKGLVEFCLLKALLQGETYGYRLVQRLRTIEGLAGRADIVVAGHDNHFLVSTAPWED